MCRGCGRLDAASGVNRSQGGPNGPNGIFLASSFLTDLSYTSYNHVQVAVDISTPPAVFDAVKADLEAFFAANAGEYSGKFLCVANFAGDPLKFTLWVS